MTGCPRETEVHLALRAGRVPDELRAHAAGCPACGDLLVVAEALLEERREALAGAPVPASGLVWWRIERRERHERARAARRSIAAVQVGVVGLGLAAAALLGGVGWVANLGMPTAETVARLALPAGVAAAAWLVLLPVAAYLALTEE